jgi:hypothetical protein
MGLCLLTAFSSSKSGFWFFLEVAVFCLGTGIYLIKKIRGKVKEE